MKSEKMIQEVVGDLLEKMGFSCEVVMKNQIENGEERIVADVKTEESSFLIGQYGVNLESLQHLVRILIRKKTEEKINFVLDVNSYRQEKNEAVLSLARNLAKQAVEEKRAVVMRPMSSFERRLVHLELSSNPQVETESTGEGENRKIIIKPAGLV